MNKNIKYSIIVVLAIALVLFSLSYFKPQSNKTTLNQVEQKEKVVKLKFASHKVPLATPYIIAKEKGFFEKNGLDVEMIYFTTGLETLHALTANQADFASTGTTPYVHFSFQRDDVHIISQVTLSNDIQIIARKDKVNNLTDLKGKKIGFVQGTVTKIAIINTLKEIGLTENDYELVMFNQPIALPNSILNQEIDAYAIWEPIISNGIKALGENNSTIFGDEKGLHGLPYFTVIRQDYITENNEEIIDKFNRSLVEAVNYIQNNREESIKTVSEIVKIDQLVIEKIWEKYNFEISLKKSLLDELNYEKNWFKPENPKINPDYKNLINSNSLKRISPDKTDF